MSYMTKDSHSGKLKDFQSFIYLLRFAKKHTRKFFQGMLLLISSSAATMVSARLLGILIDKGLVPKNTIVCIQIGISVLILEMMALFLLWRGRKIIARASLATLFIIRAKLFDHIQKLPLRYFDKTPQGRTVTRLTHDVEGIEEFLTQGLGRLLDFIIVFIMAFVAMMGTSPRYGLLMLVSLIPAVALTLWARRPVREFNRNMSRLNSRCNAKLSEFLNGIFVIRSHAIESWSQKKYGKEIFSHLDVLLTANSFYGLLRPATNLLCALPLFVLLLFVAPAVISKTLSVGIFVSFLRYIERMMMPLIALTREIHLIQQAITSAERIMTFLQEGEESTVLGEDGKIKEVEGRIHFENISMKYEEQWVLKNINLHIEKGKKVGLVGATGSGKTTAISLLNRLYPYQEGQIYVDNKKIETFERASLRAQIGMVTQDVFLFKGTLRENLTFDVNVTDEDLLHLLDRTGFSKLLAKHGRNLNSLVLEKGMNFSQGERQMVSLIRILLLNPKILILDEATANVDSYHEECMHDLVEELMDKRTCLIVAHRLDTLKKCDYIYVFGKGQIIEEGTINDLVAQKGHFYEMQHLS